jgi:hypothetical protein
MQCYRTLRSRRLKVPLDVSAGWAVRVKGWRYISSRRGQRPAHLAEHPRGACRRRSGRRRSTPTRRQLLSGRPRPQPLRVSVPSRSPRRTVIGTSRLGPPGLVGSGREIRAQRRQRQRRSSGSRRTTSPCRSADSVSRQMPLAARGRRRGPGQVRSRAPMTSASGGVPGGACAGRLVGDRPPKLCPNRRRCRRQRRWPRRAGSRWHRRVSGVSCRRFCRAGAAPDAPRRPRAVPRTRRDRWSRRRPCGKHSNRTRGAPSLRRAGSQRAACLSHGFDSTCGPASL